MQARWNNPENVSASLSYLTASFLKFSVQAKNLSTVYLTL